MLRVRQQPRVTVLASVAEVPGLGWRGWSPGDAAGRRSRSRRPADGVGADGGRATGRSPTGRSPSPSTRRTARSSIDGVAGFGRLVDGGDVGDTYNWCPPADDVLVDRPTSVDVAVLERGPVRARVLVVARLPLARRPRGPRPPGRRGRPPGDAPRRAAGRRAARCGSRSTVDNRRRDHRLRVHLPAPLARRPAREAECAFAVVERGLDGRGRPDRGRRSPPTRPGASCRPAGSPSSTTA